MKKNAAKGAIPMRKLTFGTPEKFVPTRFCKGLRLEGTDFIPPEITFRQTPRGCLLEMPLAEDEHVYGLGLQLKGFDHRQTKKVLRVNADPMNNAGDTHAPVPFFVTTKGLGVYVDTARYAEFYLGYAKLGTGQAAPASSSPADSTQELYRKRDARETRTISIVIPAAQGVDVYLFKGENITDAVSQYNRFSGGGCPVPDWGLGVLYRCYTKYTAEQVLELARYFRDRAIPCDTLGLEPGWQTQTYSCSYLWDTQRYPEPEKTLRALKDLGFHVNLWEHAYVHPSSPLYEPLKPYAGDYAVWNGLVPDFSEEAAQEIFAGYHKARLTDLGVDGFKLDECDGSDYTGDWIFPLCAQFPGGMDGEQYHSLFGTLYMQTILQALDGAPTLSQVRNAGALAASYPFVLYSDLYSHQDFIRGTVNAGFSGLLWCPEVREGKSREDFLRRVQTVVFSDQCQINAWYCEKAPWLEWDCEDEVRALFEVRRSLLPMLRRAFDQYHTAGKPPVRALVSDYTDDPETYAIDDEYLFCDRLLVAPITAAQEDRRKVYLPQGTWRDYWTGERVESGWHTVCTRNIPVYEKADA